MSNAYASKILPQFGVTGIIFRIYAKTSMIQPQDWESEWI